jgi:hypothetical protein
MTNRFMMSVAAAALIAGAGFANAQGTGTSREAPSGGSTLQQSPPSSGNSAAPSNRDAAEPTKPSSGMKATQSDEKSPGAGKNQRAEDKDMQGQKSKSMSSENDKAKGGKDIKAEGREGSKDMKAEGSKDMKAQSREGQNTNMNAEQKGAADSKSQTTTQSQPGQTGQSQTTVGQAGAAAKLSTEQRTQITTVIRNQHVQPLSNVNFTISVGTRVPREVRFHPLPREVVTIYPEWRGYEFVLVNNQIVVVDPRTFEIVAILEA